MSVIIIPRRHLRQPQGRLAVAPAWEGRMVSLVHFGDGRAVDIADENRLYAPSGTVTPKAGTSAMGLRIGDGGSLDYFEAPSALSGLSGRATLVAFFNEIDATQSAFGGVFWSVGGQYYCQFRSAGNFCMFGGAAIANTIALSSLGTINTSVVFRGTDGVVFLNGLRNDPGSNGTAFSAGAKTVRIGWTATNNQFHGTFGSLGLVSGELTDEEAIEFSRNPWMAYRADPVRIYSFPTGAISINSILASNITQTGARITLGLTR